MTTSNEATAATPAAAPPATPAVPPAAPAADAAGQQPAAADSLLSQAGEGGAPAADPAQPPAAGDDWLPAKFRVVKEDGTLDEAASARKLADSYKALEAHKGALPEVPASPEEYKLQPPEGVDPEGFKEWTADPLFKAFAADAHKHGMTNEQLQFVAGKYLEIAPALMAEKEGLSTEEAKAELQKVWPTDQALQQGIGYSLRAINAFGAPAEDVPGSIARLQQKYGNDPDFIAFTAAIGKELQEDKPASGVPLGAAGQDPEELAKHPAYFDPNHPDHARIKAQVQEAVVRKYGTAPRGRV